MSTFTLPLCKPGEKLPMEASKWLDCQVLLDEEEMRHLFETLDPFHIFLSGVVVNPGEGEISKGDFLQCYTGYVTQLREGRVPETSTYRPYFSSSFTVDPECFYAVNAGEKHIIRIAKPTIQLQAHAVSYSQEDNKFRSMVLGNETILWGIQFSYPQLYYNPNTKEVKKVDDSLEFPNTKVFRRLQRWMREATVPTPFVVDQKIVNVPIRLGKKCIPWIHKHPQLPSHHLQISFVKPSL